MTFWSNLKSKVTGACSTTMTKLNESYSRFKGIVESREANARIVTDDETKKRYVVVRRVNTSKEEFNGNRDDMVKTTYSSLNDLVNGEFSENDANALEGISEDYGEIFRRYGAAKFNDNETSFLGQKNKKAILTLEALAEARADFIKNGRKGQGFREFLLEQMHDEQPYCLQNDGDKNVAIVTKYGTMHSDILEDVLKLDSNQSKFLRLVYTAGRGEWNEKKKELHEYYMNNIIQNGQITDRKMLDSDSIKKRLAIIRGKLLAAQDARRVVKK